MKKTGLYYSSSPGVSVQQPPMGAAKKAKIKVIRPRKSGAIPATAKMLGATRAELKSNLTTLRIQTRDGFKKVDSSIKQLTTETNARFEQLEAKMNIRFAQVDARFEQLETKMNIRFAQVDARFERLEAKMNAGFSDIKATVSEMNASIHRMLALYEEQNARNIFVLDGYTSLNERLDRLEGR